MGNMFAKPKVTPASQIVANADKASGDDNEAAEPPKVKTMPDPDPEAPAAKAAAVKKFAEIANAGSSSESTSLTENRLGDISKAVARFGKMVSSSGSQIIKKG